MENRKSITCGIGFADSEALSFKSDKDTVTVYLQAWNGVILKIEFIDYLCFFNLNTQYISDLCENSTGDLLQKVLDRHYQEIPFDHGYKLYQFIDISDDPVTEIVCKNLLITDVKDYP
ncbi:MAG: hypothetical protein BGO14_00855 [Chlamydiales bacterium 38-26]|nr:hypothetical protein [Chlamydiales bacterium]OJV07271.1 MAG: hypothetical protein BGO14_00855 [Chlamydiales bacterium 38-26]